jgi:hypothetical protein
MVQTFTHVSKFTSLFSSESHFSTLRNASGVKNCPFLASGALPSQTNLICENHRPQQLLPEDFQPLALVIDVSKGHSMHKKLSFLKIQRLGFRV